jgi:hypothetical protein
MKTNKISRVDPRFSKGDRAVVRIPSHDITATVTVLDSNWNGHHHIYLVEDIEQTTILIPEEHLSPVS